eukprot:10676501-Ditylum_brightwellii.AAC.1
MPSYIVVTLYKFQHSAPKRLVHTPHPYTQPVYHQGPQPTPEPDCSSELPQDDTKCIQQILGTLLYYA